MTANNFCRACGYDYGTPIWHEDDYPLQYSFICPCCGAQVGYHDVSEAGVRLHRMQWLENGAKWVEPKEQTADWDVFEQLKRIPPPFR
jgi:hypothetical protein